MGMVPEHIMGKAVLKMTALELQEFIQAQCSENPALTLEEARSCPICGGDLVGEVCASCGSQPIQEKADDVPDEHWTPIELDDSALEPFAFVASPQALADYLKEQICTQFPDDLQPVAEFIVDSLDEDGYLREPLIELASQFCLSVPQLESVLVRVQSLDPPGIAARDLQECLLIQLRRLNESFAPSPAALAERLLAECWEGVSHMRLDKVAERLGTSREAVQAALRFIREELNPHPASLFRDPWERLAPRRVSRQSPDIEVRLTDDGLTASVVDPAAGQVTMDHIYASLYEQISERKNGMPDADRAHIKECVHKANALIEALEFRRYTIRRIADELIRAQADFFINGPTALKPMTRKELAEKLGVHESTVCRATQDKTLRLPTGEVIGLDVLFDSALPTKEMVRMLVAQSLTDGEIAGQLNDAGVKIARRTVAKYRDQLRLLPLQYRAA
jgi:RNA polymerase sigma-54 factor